MNRSSWSTTSTSGYFSMNTSISSLMSLMSMPFLVSTAPHCTQACLVVIGLWACRKGLKVGDDVTGLLLGQTIIDEGVDSNFLIPINGMLVQ